MIRVLHTADFHLDKEFFPENPKLSALRKKEQQALFANVMMYVRDQKVDVMLVSGDLLDRTVPTEETGRLLLREFENTPDTEIFISPGQNDPMRPGSFYAVSSFPQNVHIFDAEKLSYFTVDRLNLTVYGYAFCHRKLSRSPIPALPEIDPSRFNLFCACGSLYEKEGVPCFTEELIARSGMDYLAFGGDHAASELQSAGSSYYAVAGSPEGLSFEETGRKGVRIVAMEKAGGELLLRSRDVPFSRRRFEKIALDAEGLSDGKELVGRLAAAMREIEANGDTLIEATVTGKVPVSFRLRQEDFSKLAEKVCWLSLKDETVMVCGEEAGDKSFKGVFADMVKKKTGDELLRSEILKCGFESIEGR